MTYIRAWMSLKIGQIPPRTTELAVRLMFPFFLALYNRSQVSIVALWATCSGVVSVSCFGVRVSVMFHFMFVHYTLSSVWVADWPPFAK